MDGSVFFRQRRELVRHHLPAVGWSLIVAVLLLMPGDALADVGGWDWLDKPVHALLFAIHFLLLERSLRAVGVGRRSLVAAAGSGLWALVLEAAQMAVPGRIWSGWDLAADLAGIALAALARAAWRARLAAAS